MLQLNLIEYANIAVKMRMSVLFEKCGVIRFALYLLGELLITETLLAAVEELTGKMRHGMIS